MSKAVVGIFLSLLLSGCVNNRIYVQPTGETLKISFNNHNDGFIAKSALFFEDDYDCYDHSVIGILNQGADLNDVRIKFRGNYTMKYIQYYALNEDGAKKKTFVCDQMFTFKTKKDFEYSIFSDFRDQKCFLGVFERPVLIADDSLKKWSKVELVERRSTPKFFEAGPWCAADERFKGSSSLPVPRGSEKK